MFKRTNQKHAILLLSALFLLATFSLAQSKKATLLSRVTKSAVLNPGETLIYGSFLRKPGAFYGDFQHFIRILNIETKEMFLLEVKTYEVISAKETSFCHYLKPGTYEILSYQYAKTTWYGEKIFNRPIFENLDYNEDIKAKLDSGSLKETDLIRFTFKIENNGLYYLGKWNFDAGIVSFSNDKHTLDEKNSSKFHFLKFESAGIAIPN